jgi:hypothetical protein
MKHIWNTVTTNRRIIWGWTFTNRCLNKIFYIFWPYVLFTEALWRCTQDKLLAVWTKMQKWKYAGHKMRKDCSAIASKSFSWNPHGQWSKGRKTKKGLQNNRGGRWISGKDYERGQSNSWKQSTGIASWRPYATVWVRGIGMTQINNQLHMIQILLIQEWQEQWRITIWATI